MAPSLQVKDERSIRVEELVEFTNIVRQIIVQKRIDDLEPPRVSRRLHFLRGWESSWEDQADIHQKSVSVQSGWCSSTRESTGSQWGRNGVCPTSIKIPSRVASFENVTGIRACAPIVVAGADRYSRVPRSGAGCESHYAGRSTPQEIVRRHPGPLPSPRTHGLALPHRPGPLRTPLNPAHGPGRRLPHDPPPRHRRWHRHPNRLHKAHV